MSLRFVCERAPVSNDPNSLLTFEGKKMLQGRLRARELFPSLNLIKLFPNKMCFTMMCDWIPYTFADFYSLKVYFNDQISIKSTRYEPVALKCNLIPMATGKRERGHWSSRINGLIPSKLIPISLRICQVSRQQLEWASTTNRVLFRLKWQSFHTLQYIANEDILSFCTYIMLGGVHMILVSPSASQLLQNTDDMLKV